METNKIINFDSVERFSPDYKYGLNTSQVLLRRQEGLFNSAATNLNKKYVVLREGKELEVSASEIVLDDVVVLKSGDTLNFDAVVMNGNLVVDESLATGNGLEPFKKIGDTIISGTKVLSGEAYVKAEKIGEFTYVEAIRKETKKLKKPLNIITKIFLIVALSMLVLLALIIILNVLISIFSNNSEPNGTINNILVEFFFAFPFGFCIISLISLLKISADLKKKNVIVKNINAVCSLPQTKVVCFDKTGIMTNGELKVLNIEILDQTMKEDQINQIISNILLSVNDDNEYASALKKYFNYSLTANASKVLSFNSENKYSGASFKAGKTYILGVPAFLNLENKQSILRRENELVSKGMSVLVLGKSNKEIIEEKFDEELSPVCLVVLREKANENIAETINYLKEVQIPIKVISGDHAQISSEISKEAGVENAERFISLEGMGSDDVRLAAEKHTVFGKATAEQKETLVNCFKNNANVCFIGNGINDMLALKSANYSICISSQDEIVKEIGDVAISNSETQKIKDLFVESAKLCNWLIIAWPLLLSKLVFSFIAIISLLIASAIEKTSLAFPYTIGQSVFIDVAIFGVSSLALVFENNDAKLGKISLKQILGKAVFIGLLLGLALIIPFTLLCIESNNVLYFGIIDETKAVSVASAASVILACAMFVKSLMPLNKKRTIVLLITAMVILSAILYDYLVFINGFENLSFMGILFGEMTLLNYFTALVIAAILSVLYIGITHILNILEKEKSNANI